MTLGGFNRLICFTHFWWTSQFKIKIEVMCPRKRWGSRGSIIFILSNILHVYCLNAYNRSNKFLRFERRMKKKGNYSSQHRASLSSFIQPNRKIKCGVSVGHFSFMPVTTDASNLFSQTPQTNKDITQHGCCSP